MVELKFPISSVLSLFKPREPEYNSIASRQADINIFTVASGLLYEVGFHHIPFTPKKFY